ncbi:MAG: methylisocitrate lyase, partial [Shewanella sp.]
LAEAGADMVLYPLSTFRAANQAALKVMQALMHDGHQRNVLDTMQTRKDLYQYLGYHAFEDKLDELFSQDK